MNLDPTATKWVVWCTKTTFSPCQDSYSSTCKMVVNGLLEHRGEACTYNRFALRSALSGFGIEVPHISQLCGSALKRMVAAETNLKFLRPHLLHGDTLWPCTMQSHWLKSVQTLSVRLESNKVLDVRTGFAFPPFKNGSFSKKCICMYTLIDWLNFLCRYNYNLTLTINLYQALKT